MGIRAVTLMVEFLSVELSDGCDREHLLSPYRYGNEVRIRGYTEALGEPCLARWQRRRRERIPAKSPSIRSVRGGGAGRCREGLGSKRGWMDSFRVTQGVHPQKYRGCGCIARKSAEIVRPGYCKG